LPVRRHYLFRRYWIDSSATLAYATKVGGRFIGTTFDGDCGYTAEEESGKITGAGRDLIVWNLSKSTKAVLRKEPGRVSMYT
jgi:hypothetical protein